MFQIELKKLSLDDLEQVYQIDRSENVDRIYRPSGAELEAYDCSIEVSSDPEFWEKLLAWWKDELQSGAEAFGAFDGEHLTGIAMLKHRVAENTDEIIAMYVSAEYRLSGIAKSLYFELEDSARASGATDLIVTTTPTGAAIEFYQSQGFQFDAGANCRMGEEEEKEIPMRKKL